jgi:hypothetical protein
VAARCATRVAEPDQVDVEATVKQRAARAKKDAKAAAAEVAKLERRLDSARVKFLDDAFTRGEYEELRAGLEEDLTAARERLAAAEALARDLQTNGHDHAEAIHQARELARNEAPGAEERERYQAFLQAHFDHFIAVAHPVAPDLTDEERARAERLLDERPAEDLDEEELTLVERLLAEHQRRDFAGLDWEQSARFGPWKAQRRGMMQGVLIAEFRPEVEARFAIDMGEQPKVSLEALRGGT